jgi:hypothetical protein
MNELRDLIKRYDLSEDILDFKKRNVKEIDLLKCFVSNTANPYLEMKAASGIKGALIKANYSTHPKSLKLHAARQKYIDDEIRLNEQKQAAALATQK